MIKLDRVMKIKPSKNIFSYNQDIKYDLVQQISKLTFDSFNGLPLHDTWKLYYKIRPEIFRK